MKKLALTGILALLTSGCSTGWTTSTYKDFHTAASPIVTTIKPIKNSRKYGTPESYLYVMCHNKSRTLEADISFSFNPLIVDYITNDGGYDTSKGRFKWDNQYEDVTFFHPDGAHKLLIHMDDRKLIKKIISHKHGTLEFNLVEEGKVEFLYTFKNAAESIAKIGKECGKQNSEFMKSIKNQ